MHLFILCTIGVTGFVLSRRNLTLMLISTKIVLLSITFLILTSAASFDDTAGQVYGICVNKDLTTILEETSAVVLAGTGMVADDVAVKTETVQVEKNIQPRDWHEIDWKKAWKTIGDLQEKISIAALKKDYKKVYRLQWVILNSFSGKALAVRKVVTNSGGKTAGTDGVVWRNPSEYFRAIGALEEIVKNPDQYRAAPLRRVLIPKGNTGETRPLGIPTVMDRAVQAVYHLGLDPVIETKSDKNSFGFRKNRSTHDAIIALRSHMDKTAHPHWILEADISKCFDRISHEFLLVHTPICHKNVLEQWLKSGVMENWKFSPTESGTPQGGVISPTLCNIALNGIEDIIRKANPNVKGISAGVHLIRYADDMIITGKNQEICVRNKEILSDFLKVRGLELNEKKTKITNIQDGIDFLGFNIRRMTHDPRLNKETDQETVLIIKPSAKGTNGLKEKVREIIDRKRPIERIIKDINPVLRGWGEHKRISYHSQETFISLDHWIYTLMEKWTTRHKGSRRRAINRYLFSTSTRKWNWGVSEKEKILNLGEIPIISPKPMKLDRNPYLSANKEYFDRRKEKQVFAKFRASVYRKYKGLCPTCNQSLFNGESVELHHIHPVKTGGKYKMDNIIPLHRICHQQVTHRKPE